jgi:ABC-type multidrug transport system fused ATPase/permease subunit
MFDDIKKIFIILSPKQLRYIYILIIFSLIASVFELFSIALIIPIIDILAGESSNIFFSINNLKIFLLNYININQLNLLLIFFFIIFFLTKTIFLSFFTYKNSQFINNLYKDLSVDIFRNYLFQKYELYLNSNSAKKIQNLTNEVSNFTSIYISSLIILISEIVILLSISVVLLFVSVSGFFSIFFLFSFLSIIFIYAIKKYLKIWSVTKQNHQTRFIKYIQEGLRNIKYLKISGIENKFLNEFSFHINEYVKIETKFVSLSSLPKYYIELFGILALSFGFCIFYYFQYQNYEILIILSVFALSTIRILPSLNRILNAIIKLKYGHASVIRVYEEKKILESTAPKNFNLLNNRLKFNNEIVLQNLSFGYLNSNRTLLENINITIPLNKIVGIFGLSGSGKTTLLDLVSGIIEPSSGKILVDGINIHENLNLRQWQNNISYVQQSVFLFDDTILKNIIFASKDDFPDKKNIDNILNIVGLNDFLNKLPNKINSKVGELGNNLSGGQRQKIGIARALYMNSKLIILDEATNSLDEESEIKILKEIFLLKKNKTVIIVSHKKELMNYCDIIFEVNNKNINVK